MNLADTLSAVSILAAILTFFFELAGKSITEALEIDPASEAQVTKRRSQKELVLKAIFLRGVPVLIGAIALFYICLPQTCDILRTSGFHLWRFDIIRTLFVLLEICLLILVLLTLNNIRGLYGVLEKIRKKAKPEPG